VADNGWAGAELGIGLDCRPETGHQGCLGKKTVLYLVATPIGNLSDISLRALEVLREVDFIASEDTRKTGRLLKHFEIKCLQISFHEHNERRTLPRIVGLLKTGKSVALVTNAGTPGISDPGFTLVRAAIEHGIEFTMIPGPAALVMALVLSGLAVHSFNFRGYPPRKPSQRRTFLAGDKDSPHTLIYYESPYRLRAFLADAVTIFGDRPAALAKELTKMFESIRRGPLSGLLAQLEEKPKGEYVVVIAGAERTARRKS
jgi:16S rRNA (cytidine1402-2'-O)-methyltransferase